MFSTSFPSIKDEEKVASPRPPSIEQLAQLCGAHGTRFFRSQVQLFEYIKEQNEKILDQHLKSHQSLVSTSHRSMMMQHRYSDASSVIFSSNNNNNGNLSGGLFNGSTTSNSTAGMMMMTRHNSSRQQPQQQQQQQQENEKPIEDKLLRPFQVHADLTKKQNNFDDNNNNSNPYQLSHKNQFLIHRQPQQNTNNFVSISSSGNSSSEKGLLAMFNEAGKTQRENLSTTSSGIRRQREIEEHNIKQQQQQPNQQQQERFFVAMTREAFSRFSHGDVVEGLPQQHQHFFEIIEENAPCTLYFDVEMEPHTALKKEDQDRMILEVEALEQRVCGNRQQEKQEEDSADSTSLKLRDNLPDKIRKKLRCCPVGCNVQFDETRTRDILVRELKHFINDEFPLPLADFTSNSSAYATIDENSFIVLVSPSPKKFSQHYIIRFKEDDARFANNAVDQKLVVTCFVDYLYEKAFHNPEVHAALFYHETTENRTAVVSLNSEFIENLQKPQVTKSTPQISAAFAEEYSFAVSPAQKRAIKLREEKKQQQQLQQQNNNNNDNDDGAATSIVQDENNQSGFFASSYSAPAISLKCVIDEAVYTKNRMMRCYGSSKVGKLAVLEFDHSWHQGGRLNHFLNGNRNAAMMSTLISEPLITVTDEKLKAAKLFRLIDSGAIQASVLARGGRAAINLQQISSTVATSKGNGGGLGVIQNNSNSAFNPALYNTTTYKGHEIISKFFPLLCKEICINQNIMEKNPTRFERGNDLKQFLLNNPTLRNSGNVQLESLEVSLPKPAESANSNNNNNNTNTDTTTTSRFLYARIVAKIRNSKFCHVVKRQHRSNGIFWTIKCNFPLSVPEHSVNSSSPTFLIGSAWMDQRCFDQDCKERHQFTVDVPTEAVAEIRNVLKIPDVTYFSQQQEQHQQNATTTTTLLSQQSPEKKLSQPLQEIASIQLSQKIDLATSMPIVVATSSSSSQKQQTLFPRFSHQNTKTTAEQVSFTQPTQLQQQRTTTTTTFPRNTTNNTIHNNNSNQFASSLIPCSINPQKGGMSVVKSGAIPLSNAARMAIEEQKRINLQQQQPTHVILPPQQQQQVRPPQQKVTTFGDVLRKRKEQEAQNKQ